jgi:hypothetical protein
VVAIKEGSRRLLILDQCLGIAGSGSDYMTLSDRKILLIGDDVPCAGQRLSELILLQFENLVRELDEFECSVE